jgi:glycosyltransferase involved in cell wall biosynthesis
MDKVIIVRSRAIDPTVNRVAKALADSKYEAELLLWAREGIGHTEIKDGYRIYKFGLKAPYYKPSLLLYLPIWWFSEFMFLLTSRPSVIHACDLDTLIPAILAGKIMGTKVCYTIYDFYADILPQQVPGIVKKLVASIERFSLRFVDVLFLVDRARFEQVGGARIKKVEYIVNSPEDLLRPKLDIETHSKLSMFYAGYLDKSRGLEELINGVRELDDITLTIAGSGEEEEYIKAISKRMPNLQFLGQIPYQEVISRELDADILFAFYDPKLPSNKYASPNKLFEAMMCAKPIIVNEGTTVSEIVSKHRCGLIVPYGDIGAIKAAVVNLQSNPDLRQWLGWNGRRAYEQLYSWDIMKSRLVNAYKTVAN